MQPGWPVRSSWGVKGIKGGRKDARNREGGKELENRKIEWAWKDRAQTKWRRLS